MELRFHPAIVRAMVVHFVQLVGDEEEWLECVGIVVKGEKRSKSPSKNGKLVVRATIGRANPCSEELIIIIRS